MEGRDPVKPIPPHGLPQGTLASSLPQVQHDATGVPWLVARQTPGLSMSQLSPVSNHTGPRGPSRTHTRSGNMWPELLPQHQMTLQAGGPSSPIAQRQGKQGLGAEGTFCSGPMRAALSLCPRAQPPCCMMADL